MRRLAFTCSLAILALVVPRGTFAANWPQFHFAADRTGFNPAETILSPANVADLSLSWTRTFAAPVTAPVVADGRVYVGSNDGNVYALDAATGAMLWVGTTGGSIIFSPAVDGGRVFVASADSNLYAFPASCSTPCAPLWTAVGGGGSPPAVASDVVYTGAGGLSAFDAVSGVRLWTAPLSNAGKTPAVANGVVYTTDFALYAFPASCSDPCSPLWLGFNTDGEPAVAQDTVYVDAGYVNFFYAFPASCATPCAPLWTAVTDRGERSAPALAYSLVFKTTGVVSAFPAACAALCSPVWTATMGGVAGGSSPSIANGVVYVGSGDGSLYAYNAMTGAKLATIAVGGLGVLSPAVADGAVYVSSPGFVSSSVSAYRLASRDTTPPVIAVPGPITTNATSPNGAVVSYAVSATDPDDAVASLNCVPASGSTFPIGTTTVTCTATDTNGNSATASFTIRVKGAAEQLADLAQAVVGVGPGTSLVDKVRQAQTYLHQQDVADTCATLQQFIDQVRAQSGKSIPPATASALIGDATRIKAVLGC
jgi:outer membrane protein assembly factor BamB